MQASVYKEQRIGARKGLRDAVFKNKWRQIDVRFWAFVKTQRKKPRETECLGLLNGLIPGASEDRFESSGFLMKACFHFR